MIVVDVPGKLYVAGEYAVLEPGGVAVLAAVDRFLTVRLTVLPSQPRLVRTVTTDHTGDRTVELVHRDGTCAVTARDDQDAQALKHVSAAIRLVERYAEESGSEPVGFHLDIRSGLDDVVTGRKFGLGSSGAVTVGVIRALCEAYRFGLGGGAMLKLAILATMSVDPGCSGGDVAASMLGGWVAYRAPDRLRLSEWLADPNVKVRDLLVRPWPYLAARTVPAPRRMCLQVGWTGCPSRSSRLVDTVRHGMVGQVSEYRRFVASSNTTVSQLVTALESGDDLALAGAAAEAGRLLRRLGVLAGVDIETIELRRLRTVAERIGAVAKTSGAGGGDCGIALVAPAAAADLRRRWRSAGIQPLDVRVQRRATGWIGS